MTVRILNTDISAKWINILGINYQIIEVDVVSKRDLCYGEIDFVEQVIRIDKSLKEEKKQQTLIHEILHAIFDAVGLYELGQDEKAVQSIATALYLTFSTQTIFSS